MSPSFFTPSSACLTTLVATRLIRATGDCDLRVERFLEPDFFPALFRLLDFRELLLALEVFRVLLLRAVFDPEDFRPLLFLVTVDFRRLLLLVTVDFRRLLLRAPDAPARRVFFAVDFRALAPRFRADPLDFFALDDLLLDALRPDFLLDDLLRVAIGQLLVGRVCTAQRKFHAQCVVVARPQALNLAHSHTRVRTGVLRRRRSRDTHHIAQLRDTRAANAA